MINGRFEDECLMIFAVLLVKSGATMDLRCYKLITAQIKKTKKKFHLFESLIDHYYLSQIIN